jgi:tRNA pseudouridine55 synthase
MPASFSAPMKSWYILPMPARKKIARAQSTESVSPTGVLPLNKPLGRSSHRMAMELSERFKTVVTHTGNLDPMAEGVMVFLIGEEALKNQIRLQDSDKEYEFEVLFGFSTDTQDLLGIVKEEKEYKLKEITVESLSGILSKWIGTRELQRPGYSYKVVKGKPLYWWARRGRLNEIEIPTVSVSIRRAELIGLRTVTSKKLAADIEQKIARVEGDFRQEAILKRWDTVLSNYPNRKFAVARIRIECSKGTYVRSLARLLGESLGVPSLASSIVRTRVGDLRLSDCEPLPIGMDRKPKDLRLESNQEGLG